jgi:uncharacterized protein (DUF2141 family)
MPCSNSNYLVCCYDPTKSFSVCNPTINGTPNSSFNLGTTYVSLDPINGNSCFSASTTPVGTVYNYGITNFQSITNGTADCDQCTFDYGAGCPIVTSFANAILENCCNASETLQCSVPSTYTPGIVSFRYNDKCWTLQSYGGPGGVNLIAGYDGCAGCTSTFPCVEPSNSPTPTPTVTPGYVYYFTGCCTPYTQIEVISGVDLFVGPGGFYLLDIPSIPFNDCVENVASLPGPYLSYVWNTGTDSVIGTYFDCGDCQGFNPSAVCDSPTPTKSNTPTPTPTVTVTRTLTPTPTLTSTPGASPSQTRTPTPTPTNSGFGNGLTFSYELNITGTCETGLGRVEIVPTGGVAPYTFNWYSPNLGTGAIKTGLPAGTYLVRANDSAVPVNAQFYINVTVGGCICVDIVNVNPTTCGLDNGSVTATTTSSSSTVTYRLYNSADTLIDTVTALQPYGIFSNLDAGSYYITATDTSGGFGTSQSFVIQDSNPLDFGLYVVPNASCDDAGTPIGKIFVTGQTGTGPYTYLWSNGGITSSITGLTEGVYSVQVTDSGGCSTTKQGTITRVNALAFGSFVAVPPTCFENDGSLTLTVVGGTEPFYYSASTGNQIVSYSRQFTLSNIGNGTYEFAVTDAGLCKLYVGTTLQSEGGISSVSVTGQNSNCNQNDGQITVTIVGGVTPYTITLVNPNGDSTEIVGDQTVNIFSNLGPGTYSVFVQDTSGCVYTTEVTLVSQDKFAVSVDVIAAACNQLNGTATVTVTSDYELPLTYSIDGIDTIIDTNLTTVVFNNVSVGQHLMTVTDESGCSINQPFTITSSPPVEFSLYSTSCGTGAQGSITALISSGTPPFTFNWSNNVTGNPQQITVNGLTGGTYSLVVEDANGCSYGALTTIECTQNYVSFQTYTMGTDEFTIVSPTKCGIIQILNDGFADLTEGYSGCVLNSAEFIAKVQVQPQGTVLTNSFYTGYSLIDVPSDNLWYTTIETMLESIVGIVDVIVDPLNNQIKIIADPSSGIIDQQIIVELVIVYDIECESIIPPTPSPTATPTLTPTITATPTVTPSITPTKSVTPSVTPSITLSPSTSVTPTNTATPTPSNTPPGTYFYYTVDGTYCCPPYSSFTNLLVRWSIPLISVGSYNDNTGVCYDITSITSALPSPGYVDIIVGPWVDCATCISNHTPCVSVSPSATPTITPTITRTPTVTPTTTKTPTPTPTLTQTPSVTPTLTPSVTPSSELYPYFLAGYCYDGRMYAEGGSFSSNCTQVQNGLGSATRYKSNYPYSYLYSGLWSTVNMFIYDTVTASLLNSKPIADGCQYWETSSLGKVLGGYPQVGFDCTTPGGCCPGTPPS